MRPCRLAGIGLLGGRVYEFLAFALVGVTVPATVACEGTKRAPLTAPISIKLGEPTTTVGSNGSGTTSAPTVDEDAAMSPAGAGSASFAFASPLGDTYPDDSTPKRHLTATACSGVLAAAQREFDGAFARALKACATDADCVTVHTRACLGDCGSEAIARPSTSSYEAAAARLAKGKCETWYQSGCNTMTPQPVPSCAMYVPTCNGSKCVPASGRDVHAMMRFALRDLHPRAPRPAARTPPFVESRTHSVPWSTHRRRPIARTVDAHRRTPVLRRANAS